MYAANFDLVTYFKRIGFNGTAAADYASLKDLMRCQLFAIAFENLDVQAGKVVSLAPEDIVDKILHHARGGYCYELNGLFAMALQALNIPYQFVGCRPMFYPVLRPKTHMAIIATVEGQQWLCDLGFGSYGIREPVNLQDTDMLIQQDFDQYRLTEQDKNYVLEACDQGEWKKQYGFDLYPQQWIDFSPANWMNSTHPDTIFVQKLLVLRYHPQGRDILLDEQLTSIRAGEKLITQIEKDTIPHILLERFGLNVNEHR